jgi:hypothetical protein
MAAVGTLLLPARAAAASPIVKVAVVIGNNRSLGGRRPDLHYADDDAARYYGILSTIAPQRTALLAAFDRDTARLFPAACASAVAPTRAALEQAGRTMAEQVRAASASGSETELYFVFAGHGDVDGGTGFIELSDSRFTSNDLERWLRAIPFTRAHVILDSCNSFFMLGVRKPGGRYFATPEDATRSLASRLRNVGVFLSTSSEGESFEWSELQSGIFSHVVRSGLLGAADANGDGSVSYLELSAFVATAAADVKNPNMRPHVFARGPGARDDAPIVRLADRVGVRRLSLSDRVPLRIRLRDREGLPMLDANAEARTSLEIALPAGWASGAVIERAASPRDSSPALELYAVPDVKEAIELAALEPMSARGDARGPSEIFGKLFTRPFGPRALAAFVTAQSAAPPPVFGVSREDAERMNLILGQIEAAERGQRILSGSVLLGAGTLLGGLGAAFLAYPHQIDDEDPKGAKIFGGVYAGLGALYVGYGAYTLAFPRRGEQAASEFRLTLRRTGDYAQAYVVADRRLQELAARERRQRWTIGIVGGVLIAGSVTGITLNELSSPTASERIGGCALGGSGIVVGGSLLATAFFESPMERLLRMWRQDPGLVEFQPTAAAPRGGFLLGIGGVF